MKGKQWMRTKAPRINEKMKYEFTKMNPSTMMRKQGKTKPLPCLLRLR